MMLCDAYAKLRVCFGTHAAAAEFLGITATHYASLRSGKVNMPNRTAEYIIMKAVGLDDVSTISTTQQERENNKLQR